MDTSETYIKMCEKAKEITSEHGFAEYMDWYVCKTHNRILEPDGTYYSEYDCPDSTINGNIIWLPRQDQLQEMVKRKIETHKALISRMLNAGYLTPIHWSMEQLWLAFVMKEKYGKVWNGEDWIDG